MEWPIARVAEPERSSPRKARVHAKIAQRENIRSRVSLAAFVRREKGPVHSVWDAKIVQKIQGPLLGVVFSAGAARTLIQHPQLALCARRTNPLKWETIAMTVRPGSTHFQAVASVFVALDTTF